MSEALDLTLALLVALVLTALPAIAAMLLAARIGLRAVPILLAVGMLASGVAGMLGFWTYYADPLLGESFSYLLLLGSAALCWVCGRTLAANRDLLRGLATPLVLWALASAFVFFLGFVHGGAAEPLPTAATRFSHTLPTDNYIPLFFAEWFAANGHQGSVPVFPGDWLSSDRPPLQIGYVLVERAFGWEATAHLNYQAIGVVLQQLWVIGLWALLLAAGIGRRTRGLAILAALASDVVIVNAFYVWPKLLGAAFVLAAAALVFSPAWERLARDPRGAALFAGLLALALLAHGSSLFAVLALLAVAALRSMPSRRWIAVAGLAAAVLVAPWSAYQTFEDPPGNRLLKWHLAGVPEIDERGTLESLVDSYSEAGWGIFGKKWENFAEMAGVERADKEVGEAIDALEAGEPKQSLALFRGLRFYSLLPFLGLLLVAPIAMAIGRRRAREHPESWRLALFCLGLAGLSCIVWGLLLFGPPNTIATLHIGSLVVPLLAVCGCVCGLRATYPRFALGLVGANIALVLAAYAPALTPLPGTSYSAIAILLTALSLVAFAALSFRAAAPTAPPRSAAPPA